MRLRDLLRERSVTRGAILADTQIPFQIDLRPIYEFLGDFKPTILALAGDMLDCTELLGVPKIKPDSIDWSKIFQEIDMANSMLDDLAKVCDPKIKDFWMGNHELRLEKFRNKFPKMKDVVPDLEEQLHLKKRGYRVHDQLEIVKYGKFGVFHGQDYSTFHTKNNVTNYEMNLVYGHVHTPQMYTKHAAVGHEPKMAMSLPCLCNRNPEWKQGASNSWVNGFAVFYLQPNGDFNIYSINIIDGRFVSPDGKLYGA
jgi:hypothetical protein